MNKRAREQSPVSLRKRRSPSTIDSSMRTVSSLTLLLSEDTGLEPLRPSSAEFSSSTHASRSTSPAHHRESPENSQPMATSNCGTTNSRPRIAKRLSSHFQIPLTVSSGDSREHVDQPATMTTDYPPSPVLVEDSAPHLKAIQTQVKDVTTMCKHGDTLIRTQLKTPQKQWQLQSSMLARHPIWFKQFLEK